MATHEDLSRTHEVKASSNRGFGFVFAAVFLIVAGWPLVSGGTPRWWAAVVAVAFVAITVTMPKLLALPNRLWLRLGFLLNRIMSPILLMLMFYAMVTPMGVLKRLFGKDNLRLKRGDSNETYWIARTPPGPKPDSLNHQF